MEKYRKLLGFDYDIQDLNVFQDALTHPSARTEGLRDYERLEFLGDRVLGLVVAEALYSTFDEQAEGFLAKRLSFLVSRQALMQVAESIGLGALLVLSPGEEKTGGREKRSNLANACEALIGALYVDGGLEAARQFVLMHWKELLAESPDTFTLDDAKSALQEFLQKKGLRTPTYTLLECSGEDHRPIFTVGVRVHDTQEYTVATASNKRLAEKQAAYDLLRQLQEEGL